MAKSIFLANLGSPNSPSIPDVKEYLNEFLNDPYVIDIPWALRKLLVNGIILNTRPPKTSEAYSKIWTEEGSPLIAISERLAKKVRSKTQLPVYLGMRYGKPSLQSVVEQMKKDQITETVFIPLYPQYSFAANESAIAKLKEVAQKIYPTLKIKIHEDFFWFDAYLKALAESMQEHLRSNSPDCLVFSYHGIPARQLLKTSSPPKNCAHENAQNANCCDTWGKQNLQCYRAQCFETTRRVCKLLDWPMEKVKITFQSRLGRTPWIKPYTDLVLPTLPTSGLKSIAVVSPSFTADCLETLEEIQMRYQELFLEAGGKSFHYIPCLNDSDSFADALVQLANTEPATFR